ncbi:MAG: hypothetical protein M1820_005868 [Bogoriella megaspora]|nr:MAG: hypothetical protein M1820_005868 [Bogoriella megaspora]
MDAFQSVDKMPQIDMTVPTTNKSPAKDRKNRKSRSKSIGPGGMDALKTEIDSSNRRKSAFVPQSILPSKEDEQKRREARRKSLANRRVSFAPEATLHTWDVIEYMRDATTSSASSESTRRASSIAKPSGSPAKKANSESASDSEPPSTPPEQIEEAAVRSASPAHQRDLHQKKRRRRSSGIPPMELNNPDEAYSSSPLSGESAVGSSPFDAPNKAGMGVEDEDEDTAMSLATDLEEPTVTGRTSGSSESSNDSTGSSARLDEALRQAAETAGTNAMESIDDSGDLSMEIADDSVTNAFQPWLQAQAQKARAGGSPVKQSAKVAPVLEKDKENVNPFSPAFQRSVASGKITFERKSQQDDSEDEMSMDITKAVGRILPQKEREPIKTSPDEDMSMDLTMAVGRIHQGQPMQAPERTGGAKRRRTLTSGSPSKISFESQGSPSSRRSSRGPISKRRRSSGMASNMDDESMDLTAAIGSIQKAPTMIEENRRADATLRRSSAANPVIDDDAMDLTMAAGGIRSNSQQPVPDEDVSINSNEELSMELTTVIGGIKSAQNFQPGLQPETPTTEVPPEVADVPTTPKDQNRFKDVDESTPKKLTPILEKHVRTPEMKTPPKPPKKSPRKSIGRSALRNVQQAEDVPQPESELMVPATPEVPMDERQEDKENDPPTPSPRKKEPRSAMKPAVIDEAEPTVKETKALSESMRMLSTPRKEVSQSPIRRLATPKKQTTPKALSPVKRNMTPLKRTTPSKEASSRKKVQTQPPTPSPARDPNRQPAAPKAEEEAPQQEQRELSPPHIPLQDFLDMTSIRFMDLTTTKRRHTAIPSATKGLGLQSRPSQSQQSLESCVVAGACVLPTLEMFQHACRELKSYIASGHEIVDQIAAEVAETQPALFAEYAGAPRGQKAIMDKQFGNVKTNARLLSKGMWYEWRGQLLKGLRQGLEGISEGLDADERLFEQKEGLLEMVLPELQERKDGLEEENRVLEERAREMDGTDKDELQEARVRLEAMSDEVEEKRRLLGELQREMQEKQEVIDLAKERKTEMLAMIKEAERVREECRGWSAAEVRTLQESVQALETKYGWSITSAAGTTVTMAYRNDIQLLFDISSFMLSGSAHPAKSDNSPIRLTYIGDDHEYHSRPLTTEKRFFLQMMRAHLQCLTQGQTHVKELLAFIAASWAKACAVSEAVKSLSGEFITDVSILSDEKMAIRSMMLLSDLETKVNVEFQLGASIRNGSIDISTTHAVKVAYGEKYNEPKMAEFLGSKVGNELVGWVDAVMELKERLVAKGRKGARI